MQNTCIVVPCYNEASRLRTDEFVSFVLAEPSLFVYLVNDGSSDDTGAVIAGIAARVPERIFHLDLDRNRGKAEAVRQGLLRALEHVPADFFGYWDADLSTPLAEIAHLLDAFGRSPATLAVLGSRVKRLGTDIVRNPWRHYLGRVFATAASLTLRLPVYDSQCGAKLFRRECVELLVGEPFITAWLFDIEILARMRRAYGVERTIRCVYEAPLYGWREVRGSKLRLGDLLRVPLDLLKIHRAYGRADR
jgi:glycosyltransferase involved in cell wall biosynthesis